MRNPFVSHLCFFDRLYPVVVRLPHFMHEQIARWASWYSRRRLMQRRLPDRLNLFVTFRCNLRCRHCFIAADARENGSETSLQEYETFFSKARGVFSQVLFTGGEPTLRDDLGDIIVLASRRGAVTYGTIFTNGTLQDNLLVAARQALDHSSIHLDFHVSVDGTEACHDAVRGVKGAFQRTLETMAALQGLKEKYPNRIGRLMVGTTISKQTLSELPAVIDFFRRGKFSIVFGFVRSSKVHVFNAPEPRELSDFAPAGFDEYLTVSEMEEALRVINQCLWSREPKNLAYATNRVILKTITESLKDGMRKPLCYFGLGDLVVLPNGHVAPCEMLRSFACLQAFDWDVTRLMRSSTYRDHLRKIRGCWCTHDCSIADAILYDRHLISDLFARV